MRSLSENTNSSKEYIIKLHAHHEEPGRLFLVMELAEHGDLQEYLKTHGPLDESLTRHIAWQVYQAVAFTHSMRVTHRDLKPENILITSLDPFLVKIADFGL
ncbi:unnamed protein product [Rhizoctonia solani]|uniref:Protein kinase domain-containing protein n=1 Tax=Rhizoctonia solani TaxID=456999 RepID=A0A8H3GEZ2_9AGAM|nr:unnamed protein product [Rhizoctonia solani]CAE6527930.1 unnamed protein product [Rhizoctonia solani]